MLTQAEIELFHQLMDRLHGDVFAVKDGGLSESEKDRHIDRMVLDAGAIEQLSRTIARRVKEERQE